MNCYKAAQEYAARGWAVFPCSGKEPLTPNGFKNASRDPAQLRQWFENDVNIAIATGPVSKLVVLDVDVKNSNGFLSLEALGNEIPSTLCVQTPSGGKHYYFKTESAIPCRTNFRPGLDIRGEGGYVIAPPSTDYIFVDEGLVGLAEPPEWLIKIILEKKEKPNFVLPLSPDGQIQKGEQDNALFRFACSLRRQGFQENEILAALEAALAKCPQDDKHPFTDRDIKRWMDSSAKYDQGVGRARAAEIAAKKAVERSKKAAAKAEAGRQKAERIAQMEAKGLLCSKQTGALLSSQSNVITLLSMKYPDKFWQNEFMKIDYFGQEEIADEFVNRTHTELETDQRVVFRREHIENGIADLCASNKRNPMKEWLSELKWDGVERIDKVASDIFYAQNSGASSVLVRKWMVAAVARVFEPGCKFDYMLIIIGRQGIYKSTALRTLGGDAFLDHIEDLRDKDTLMKFGKAWICEFQELSAMRRTEIEHIKAFITRQYDIFRSPYGRRPATMARHCVFAATTNDRTPLKEDDENRRFWPVICSKTQHIDLKLLREWREQLWAEAISAYRKGESLYVEDPMVLSELEGQQRELSDVPPDVWEDDLQQFFSLNDEFSINDAITELNLDKTRLPRGEMFRLANIFKRNGYRRGKQLRSGFQRGEWLWIKCDQSEIKV